VKASGTVTGIKNANKNNHTNPTLPATPTQFPFHSIDLPSRHIPEVFLLDLRQVVQHTLPKSWQVFYHQDIAATSQKGFGPSPCELKLQDLGN
jgi:hypothetical protein